MRPPKPEPTAGLINLSDRLALKSSKNKRLDFWGLATSEGTEIALKLYPILFRFMTLDHAGRHNQIGDP